MKKNIIIVVIIIILAVLGVLFINKDSQEQNTGVQGKLNIDAICEASLAYMSFPDGESAEKFVAECKEGKQPQVIEDYKKQMNLGDGAVI